MISQSWVPGEVCAYLLCQTIQSVIMSLLPLLKYTRTPYIDWKLSTHPDQLRRILLNPLRPATVWFQRGDSIFSELIDQLEVSCKGIRMLVVFSRDVLSDRLREVQTVCAAEGDLKNVAVLHFGRQVLVPS